MTPEERARSIGLYAHWVDGQDCRTWDDVRAEIAGAIRAAEAAEREACAQLATAKAWGTGADDIISAVANLIAAQIRARSSSASLGEQRRVGVGEEGGTG